MRTVLRLLKWISILIVVAIVVLTVYVIRTWDRVWDVPVPDLHASNDPAVIARGGYLVYGPAHCVQCHTTSSEEGYPEIGVRPALRGGAKVAGAPLGAIYSANLTPD